MRLGVAVACLAAVSDASGHRLRRPNLAIGAERGTKLWRQKIEVAAGGDEDLDISQIMWALDFSMSMTVGPAPTRAPVAPDTPAPVVPPPTLAPVEPPTEAPVSDPTPAPTTRAPVADPTLPPVAAPVPVPDPTPAPSELLPTSTPVAPVAPITPPPTTATPVVDPTPAPAPAPAPATESPVVDPTIAPTSVVPVADPTEIPTTATPVADPTEAPGTAVPVSDPTPAPTTVVPVVDPTPTPTTATPVTDPTPAPTSLEPTSTPTESMTPEPTTLPPETMAPAPGDTETPSTQIPDDDTLAPTEMPTTPFPTMGPVDREEVVRERCGVTSLERSRDILSVLSVVSDPVNLITFSTPEFRARNWIDQRDPAVVCANNARRIEQRYRLALFYFHMGGSSWNNCRAQDDSNGRDTCTTESETNEGQAVRWLDSANECFWFGLQCAGTPAAASANGRDDSFYPLTSIDLSANNLEGSLFSEFFGFSSLQGVFLDGNFGLTGTIPEELGDLTNLRVLDIEDSQLTGPLPDRLFDLVNLMAIELNSNQLTGTLSESIGQLTNLEILKLQNNLFVGSIPTEQLLSLTRLVTLAIEGNLFTGTLEPLCDVRDERRQENELYLQFVFAECSGDDPLVECSCCVCN